MMDNKTLMFGVGATKAGTSWLHRYLYDHPECALPNIKELHYFNRANEKHREKEIVRLETVRANLLAKSLISGNTNPAMLNKRIDEVEDWIDVMKLKTPDTDLYRQFLLRDTTEQTRLVGDITPAYGLMDAPTLIRMRDMAPDTRFVVLLRDPLDRVWSNLRMMAGWRVKEGEDLGSKANHLFSRLLKGQEEGVAKRSDYTGMLTRLQDVVPRNRIFVGFYESLFTQVCVDKICKFLGLSPRIGEFDRVIHASQPATLDPSRALAVREMLIPHYDYVQQLMGDVPTRWHQNREVLT